MKLSSPARMGTHVYTPPGAQGGLVDGVALALGDVVALALVEGEPVVEVDTQTQA